MSKQGKEWMQGFNVRRSEETKKKTDPEAVKRRRAIEDSLARRQLKEWGL